MKKLLNLWALSLLLIAIGAILLINQSKPNIKNIHIVVDLDASCNETNYLEYGSSLISSSQEREILINNNKINNNNFLTIKENQSLYDIFSPMLVKAPEIMALSAALFPHIRPKDLAAGDLYKYEVSESANIKIIRSFTIRKLDPNRVPVSYVVTRNNSDEVKPNFTITKSFPPIKEENGYIRVVVKNTLFGTFQELEFGNELMQRLIELFKWRMKMPQNVNKHDIIEILVTKFYAEDKFTGYGRIQSVTYRQSNQLVKAYYFNSKDEKVSGYYDDRGFSLEKEFLLSPVALSTATSNQQLRFHPVIRSRIRHNGIDFRGGVGTPFFSIADGEIIEKRLDKNVGNMIRIRHKYGVHSEYFHADSLEANLNVGQRVRRGQRIGKIGRTGRLCTGPHLHLGLYYLNGEKRNYINFENLRKKINDMPRLKGEYLAEFSRHSQELDGKVAKLAELEH